MPLLSEEKILEQLADFIVQTFPRASLQSVNVKDSLFEQGIVDSLGVLEILTYIETTFGTSVQDADVNNENFGSLKAITSYVQRSLKDRKM